MTVPVGRRRPGPDIRGQARAAWPTDSESESDPGPLRPVTSLRLLAVPAGGDGPPSRTRKLGTSPAEAPRQCRAMTVGRHGDAGVLMWPGGRMPRAFQPWASIMMRPGCHPSGLMIPASSPGRVIVAPPRWTRRPRLAAAAHGHGRVTVGLLRSL